MFHGALVVLTLTACMRPLLFEQTVRSLHANVTDLALVDHWVVVDDHSDEEAHAHMVNVLPHAEWIWKREPHTRGHAHSMNVLRERALRLNATYVFHWEDDWQVVVPRPYVGPAIRALERHVSWGQVLLNENYAETPHDHITQRAESLGDGFSMHIYDPVATQGRGAHYWPHYALRPHMLSARVWATVGVYNERHCHFEREYAERYFHQHGYQSGFFQGLHALHLGKKTWESEAEVPSAYALNGVKRF